MSQRYDLVVIGSGPAGQKAAVNAAKLGKRVALIEQRADVGGVCINTGTIPSKALREAVLHLTNQRCRPTDGGVGTHHITMAELLARVSHVIRTEIAVLRSQMERNNVEVIFGRATFLGEHLLCVEQLGVRREIVANKIIIAVGTCPARPASVPFTPGRVFDSDELLELERLPASMIIDGGGVIGAEYACMLQAVGLRITLIDARPKMLEFLDDEVGDALRFHMRDMGVQLRLEESVARIEVAPNGVVAELASGKSVAAETLLYTVGRQGATDLLCLENAGLTADERGRLKVNAHYQTEVEHIYAAGDVIGFPSLASTSMEQGRIASCHAFGVPVESRLPLFPYGIYTIPEISMVGPTERELSEQRVDYGVGLARYREIARGQLLGDTQGMLKLLFHTETRKLLAVHALGSQATELIHIGQAVMAFGGTLDYFVDNIFNYPTLAECYKVAALQGINRCRRLSSRRVSDPVSLAHVDKAECANATLS